MSNAPDVPSEPHDATRVGRPSRLAALAPEALERGLALLRGGCTLDAAFVAMGIARATGYNWRRRGRAQRRGAFRDFLDQTDAACAEAEAILLARVRDASLEVKHWKAAAWILERRWPKKYGRRDHRTVAGDADAPVVFELDTGGEAAARRRVDFD